MRSNPHEQVERFLEQYPVFAEVIDGDVLARGKDVSRRQAERPPMPELYCCLVEGTRCNVATLACGLDFALSNALSGISQTQTGSR